MVETLEEYDHDLHNQYKTTIRKLIGMTITVSQYFEFLFRHSLRED